MLNSRNGLIVWREIASPASGIKITQFSGVAEASEVVC
jgi:hypothetical protein